MFERLTPSVKKILIVNVAAFFAISFTNPGLSEYLAFYNPILPNTTDLFNPSFKPWQILTHMFMHAGVGHLFSNMLGLIFFGPILESFMGESKFLRFYLYCGLGALVIYASVNYFEMSQLDVNSPEYYIKSIGRVVGASGAVMGILGAFAYLFPNVEMMLMFIPIPIKAKYMIAMYALYDLFQGFRVLGNQAETGVAHFAHIGGLIVGIALIKFFKFSKKY